ncbi:MAG: tetratricopeptide repeat protein [Cyclobacteriaceae bacterium]|nr:tetratricopeptide repeat protein [Cyclobacteriaceae bacterium]
MLRLAVGLIMVWLCCPPAQSQEKTDSLLVQLASAESDSTRSDLLFQIGREHWFKRNFPEATHYLRQALHIGIKSGYKLNQADAYNLLANVYLKQQVYDSAFEYLERALHTQDEKFVPHIHETYSKLYYQLGDYQTSLKYALESADGFEKMRDAKFNVQLVFAYIVIGDILNAMGKVDDAFNYYQKAYIRAKQESKNWYVKTPLLRIAAYYLTLGNYDKAQLLYDTIITIDKNAISLEPTMFSYEGLGDIAIQKKNYRQAILHYREALRYALEKGFSASISNFYFKLGSAFIAKGQQDSAQYYLTLAVKKSETGKNYTTLQASYAALATLYKQQGHFKNALRAFELHKAYSDSVLNVERLHSVTKLEALYRTRQKENEIIRLQQESAFQIRKRNIYVGIGIGLIMVLCIIFILARRNYRNIERLQEQRVEHLEQQQQVISLQAMVNGQETERNRIAKDLHDGLGGLFSTIKMYFSSLQHQKKDLREDELFQKSYALIDSAAEEIRKVAHSMMPEVLMKLGLINAIRDLCDSITAGKLIRVSLEVHGIHNRLNSSTEIMLYRIIQELINNILKHAQATEVIIQFIRDAERLSVIVEDNGKGFNTLHVNIGNGSGLEAVKSRVNYLNGRMSIDSAKGVGTTVMMDFLINE